MCSSSSTTLKSGKHYNAATFSYDFNIVWYDKLSFFHDVLKDLRWIPVKSQLYYRDATLVFKCMTKMATIYLSIQFSSRCSISGRSIIIIIMFLHLSVTYRLVGCGVRHLSLHNNTTSVVAMAITTNITTMIILSLSSPLSLLCC